MNECTILKCVVLASLMMALCGCGFPLLKKTSAPLPKTTITNGVATNFGLGFEMTFPSTWTLTDNPPTPAPIQGTRMLTNVAKSGASVRVKVLDLARGSTLKSFTSTAMQGADKMLKDFELIGDEDLKIGSASAHKYTFCFEGATTKARTLTESITLVQGNRGYIITSAALNEDYDKYAKEITSIVQSFKFLKN